MKKLKFTTRFPDTLQNEISNTFARSVDSKIDPQEYIEPSSLRAMQRRRYALELDNPSDYSCFSVKQIRLLKLSDDPVAQKIGFLLGRCTASAQCLHPQCKTCNSIYQDKVEKQFEQLLSGKQLKFLGLTVNVKLLPLDISPDEFYTEVRKLRQTLCNRLGGAYKHSKCTLYGSIEIAVISPEIIDNYDCPAHDRVDPRNDTPVFLFHFHAAMAFKEENEFLLRKKIHKVFPSTCRRTNRRVSFRNEKLCKNTGQGLISGFIRYGFKSFFKVSGFGHKNADILDKMICLMESIRYQGIRGWRLSVNKKFVDEL